MVRVGNTSALPTLLAATKHVEVMKNNHWMSHRPASFPAMTNLLKRIIVSVCIMLAMMCVHILTYAETVNYTWKSYGLPSVYNNYPSPLAECQAEIAGVYNVTAAVVAVRVDDGIFHCTFRGYLARSAVREGNSCATGTTWNGTTGTCDAPASVPSCKPELNHPDSCHYKPSAAPANKNLGMACPLEHGNPINHGNGNKRQLEPDYLSAASGGLQLQRTYNSNSTRYGRYGARWSSNFEPMVWTDVNNYPNNAGVQRDDGKLLTFTFTLADGVYKPDADITDNLTRQTDSNGYTTSWQYRVAADQSLENYDAAGKLLSITSREGLVQTLSYSDVSTPVTIAPQPELLIRATDSFDRQLNFVYDSSSRVI
jgi:hypothetical protein